MDLEKKEILNKIANSIRCLTMDVVSHAGSGHPGMPMGCAEILAYLYGEFMQYHPASGGAWVNRDRFLLSAGHGALGQLIPLHMAGYDITIEDLKQHRQGSIKASSHPLYNPDLGIETTTGADGYGIGNAVGMALGQKILSHQFYQDQEACFNEKVIVIGGDGCFMEGISYEAAQIAGHLKLNNLIVIYDANNVSLDGYLEECCSTDYIMLYEALGFEVFSIDGHDLEQIDTVFRPLRTQQQKPVFIIANTQIGRGLLDKQGKLSAHGHNLQSFNVEAAQKKLVMDHQPWTIGPEIYDFFQEKHQENSSKIKLMSKGKNILEQDVLNVLASYSSDKSGSQPGRFLSQDILNYLATHFSQLYTGSADSAHSDGTWIKEGGMILAPDYQGRNIKFGVREFAMASIANGLSLYLLWVGSSHLVII